MLTKFIITIVFLLGGCARSNTPSTSDGTPCAASHDLASRPPEAPSTPLAAWPALSQTSKVDASVFSDMITVAFDLLFLFDDASTPPVDASTNDLSWPFCQDGLKNGDETDIDCGGSRCLPCNGGNFCLSPSDCTSQICECHTCHNTPTPHCSDGVTNYDEQGKDCGGADCLGCPKGTICGDGFHGVTVTCANCDCIACNNQWGVMRCGGGC